MKKLINDPESVVTESLLGLAASRPDVTVHLDPTYVRRSDGPVEGKVAVVSGGGSGHEPLHAGFVGMGMLDAACPGEVFTSPTPDQVYEGARAAHGGCGVLLIVKNYSGDVMNFEMAAELLHAEGVAVATVLIDDDVAVRDSLYTQGRRGVGTTLFAEKLCGAAAQRGWDLDRVAALGRRVSSGGRSMGMALTSCTAPAGGSPTFELGGDEMELGIGIHGEPGRERRKLPPADRVAELLTGSILEDPAYTRAVREWDEAAGAWEEVERTDPPFVSGDRVLALANGMGGTPLSELYIVYRKVAEICRRRGLTIERNLVGSYVTSLEMQGCAVTLVRADQEMLELWDDPVSTPALRWRV
jgi:dihydroxyacetone kinase-like protein